MRLFVPVLWTTSFDTATKDLCVQEMKRVRTPSWCRWRIPRGRINDFSLLTALMPAMPRRPDSSVNFTKEQHQPADTPGQRTCTTGDRCPRDLRPQPKRGVSNLY